MGGEKVHLEGRWKKGREEKEVMTKRRQKMRHRGKSEGKMSEGLREVALKWA